MISVTAKQIEDQAQDALTFKSGENLTVEMNEVLPPNQAHSTTLVFASDLASLRTAYDRQSRAFIIKDSLWPEVELEIQKKTFKNTLIWITPNIQMAMARVLHLFDKKAPYYKAGINPTAWIHPLAEIHPSAHIGAHCTVEAHAKIGADTILYPSVYVGAYCEVGQRCIIGPATTIGADGFGFFTDKKFTHHKIPQIGRVVIEDDCELGAHCAADRATLTETRIKRGSKIDNFGHIAHNVEIGENAIAAAGLMISGSTKIGRNFLAAGAVHSVGHIEIADQVVLTGRAGVTNDIKASGVYGGFPLETHRESLRTLATIPQIKTLKKQVTQILKHLGLSAKE